MKTTKQMIEVMQAFERGEKIEAFYNGVWEDIYIPEWSWGLRDYRIKPKPKYVPFDTAEEFLAANRKHGLIIPIGYEDKKLIAHVDKDGVLMLCNKRNDRIVWVMFEEFLRDFKFEDGTPCGKEVEE